MPKIAVLALVLAVPVSARADQSEPPARDTLITLVGAVVDAQSGAPIEGAVVRIDSGGRAVMTDSSGRFSYPEVAPGSVTIGVEQIGYQVAVHTRWAEPGALVRIGLKPDPLVLETLPVVVDRIRRRRYSKGIRVDALHRDDFPPQSMQLLSAVRSRGGLWLTPCRHAATYWCVYRRGRVISPSVWINDRYSFMGLDELEFYRTSDIYVVEIYRAGAAVRVYTDHYMQRQARRLSVLPGPIP